jgi:hypothetical protein
MVFCGIKLICDDSDLVLKQRKVIQIELPSSCQKALVKRHVSDSIQFYLLLWLVLVAPLTGVPGHHSRHEFGGAGAQVRPVGRRHGISLGFNHDQICPGGLVYRL